MSGSNSRRSTSSRRRNVKRNGEVKPFGRYSSISFILPTDHRFLEYLKRKEEERVDNPKAQSQRVTRAKRLTQRDFPFSQIQKSLEEPDLVDPEILSEILLTREDEARKLEVEGLDVEEPDVEEPDVEEPDVEEPDVEEPEVEEPEVEELDKKISFAIHGKRAKQLFKTTSRINKVEEAFRLWLSDQGTLLEKRVISYRHCAKGKTAWTRECMRFDARVDSGNSSEWLFKFRSNDGINFIAKSHGRFLKASRVIKKKRSWQNIYFCTVVLSRDQDKKSSFAGLVDDNLNIDWGNLEAAYKQGHRAPILVLQLDDFWRYCMNRNHLPAPEDFVQQF